MLSSLHTNSHRSREHMCMLTLLRTMSYSGREHMWICIKPNTTARVEADCVWPADKQILQHPKRCLPGCLVERLDLLYIYNDWITHGADWTAKIYPSIPAGYALWRCSFIPKIAVETCWNGVQDWLSTMQGRLVID